MRAAMPMLVRRSSDDNGIGTAFLAQRNSVTKLVTCAHNAENSQPTVNFHSWPREFEIDASLGDWRKVRFFAEGDTPNFAYRLKEPGKMADMIAVNLPVQLLDILQREYKVHTLDDIFTCSAGEKLVGYGYPDVADKWPPQTQLTKGKAIDGTVLAKMFTQKGFSGGPVIANGGRLAGMILGSDDDDRAVIMQAAALSELFG